MNIHDKIKSARALLNSKELQRYKKMAVKLKKITDDYELAYIDMKIKHIKSSKAEKMMNELEGELDKILNDVNLLLDK